MTRFEHSVTALLGLGLLALTASPAWAGPATDQLKTSVDRIIAILGDAPAKTDAAVKERRASIRKEADGIFDFGETARRALGLHWQGLAESDRREFVALFADLLQRAYVGKVERYSGEAITYTGEATDGDVVTVKTKFTTKQGSVIPIDYRMIRRGERWLAYDVVIEGVSLVANYRAQFDKIIHEASYAGLVTRLKASRGELEAPGGAKRKERTPRS